MEDKVTYFTKLGSILQEFVEASNAKKYANKQRRQASERLLYIPSLIKFLGLFLVILFSSIIFLYTGYIIGETRKQVIIKTVIEEKLCIESICQLPKAGASLSSYHGTGN